MIRAIVLALLLNACSPTATSSSSPTVSLTPSPTPTASPSIASPTPLAVATPGILPIVDAHMHYSAEAWNVYPPARVAALMDAAGVRTAFVSSAPDEGTFRLRDALGDRIVPLIGPYRGPNDVFGWTRDGTVIPYLDSHVRPGVHKGFGEFHLSVGQTQLPIVRAAIAFARRNGLFLQPHADAAALNELLNDVGADYVVLWAHAGVTATPEQIDALLAKWPRLWVELSLRDDVAPRGTLEARWLALFLKYPDRFMIGVDTWVVGPGASGNERWDRYAEIVLSIRGWLGQLRPDVRDKIAHTNAESFIGLFK